MLAIIDDVTAIARCEAELARARHGLRRRETLLAMGEIAAGVAHDLGNTLGALQVRAALVAREPDLTAAQREHLEWSAAACATAWRCSRGSRSHCAAARASGPRGRSSLRS